MAQLCGFEEEVVQGNGKERESGATEAVQTPPGEIDKTRV